MTIKCILSALRRLLQATRVIRWPCANCAYENDTPLILFSTLRHQLRCQRCALLQDYKNHIYKFDPQPLGKG